MLPRSQVMSRCFRLGRMTRSRFQPSGVLQEAGNLGPAVNVHMVAARRSPLTNYASCIRASRLYWTHGCGQDFGGGETGSRLCCWAASRTSRYEACSLPDTEAIECTSTRNVHHKPRLRVQILFKRDATMNAAEPQSPSLTSSGDGDDFKGDPRVISVCVLMSLQAQVRWYIWLIWISR